MFCLVYLQSQVQVLPYDFNTKFLRIFHVAYFEIHAGAVQQIINKISRQKYNILSGKIHIHTYPQWKYRQSKPLKS